MGHPDWDSFCGYLAKRYFDEAVSAGHDVRQVNIGDVEFDPILHKGYKVIQALEPDLKVVQANIKWADHLVVIYPNWWSTMPAKLKGLFDRAFLPSFSFRMKKDSIIGLWQKLLSGKTGRVIITMDGIPIINRIFIGDYSNEIRRGIMWFCGIWPTRVTSIGPVQRMDPEKRAKWGDKVAKMGAMAK